MNLVAYERPPWGKNGTYLGDVEGVLLSAEALERAGLDWEVQKSTMYAMIGDGDLARVPGHFSIVRPMDGTVMGVVGKNHKPGQNRDVFSIYDDLIPGGDVMIHTMGMIDNTVWGIFLVDTFEIGGFTVDCFSMVTNEHAGSMYSRVIPVSIVREVSSCSIMAHSSSGVGGYAIDGSRLRDEKKDVMMEAFGATKENSDRQRRFFDRIAGMEFSTGDFDRLLSVAMPVPEKGSGSYTMSQREVAWGLFSEREKTALGAYVSILEYFCHHRPTRAKDEQERRFESVTMGSDRMSIAAVDRNLKNV